MTPEELLSQLKDIHEPAAIGSWPPAPGWWIITIIAIFVFSISIYAWRSHIKKNAWKKEAKQALSQITLNTNHTNCHESLQSINQWVKRIAVYKHNNSAVKSLTGEEWYQFLNSFLNTVDAPDMFSDTQLKLLSEGQYQPHTDTDASARSEIATLLKTLNTWLRKA